MSDPNDPNDTSRNRSDAGTRDAAGGPSASRPQDAPVPGEGSAPESTGVPDARRTPDVGRPKRRTEPTGDSAPRSGAPRDGARRHAVPDARRPSPGTPSGPRPRPRHARSRFRTFAFAVLLLALAVAAFAWYRLSPPAAAPTPVDFEVEPGWGARRVASELAAEGLIRDDAAFSFWLQLRGIDRRIGEGVYELSPHLSAPEIGRRLAAGGRPRTVALLVPEGFRMSDIADRLAAVGIADAEAALQRMREPGELSPEFVPPGLGLEGYLFPASYEVEVDAGMDSVLARMVDRFRAEVGPLEADRLVDTGLRVHEWVTLASMVQAEAADESEMPVIAGVFLNRRDRGMRMQSDPTVAYGLGKDLPELDAVAGDLRSDHPWNTYTRDGLPLGPIGNPGSAALQAVLAPRRTTDAGEPWLYFLHGFDGDRPVFRPNTTLADHERDIERFLR